jgi:hypothetical protein
LFLGLQTLLQKQTKKNRRKRKERKKQEKGGEREKKEERGKEEKRKEQINVFKEKKGKVRIEVKEEQKEVCTSVTPPVTLNLFKYYLKLYNITSIFQLVSLKQIKW